MDPAFYEDKSWGSLPIKEGRDFPTLKFRRLLDAIPRKPCALLEVGCGSGRILASIAQKRPKASLFGVDTSKQQILDAQRTHKSINFRVANGERLPFKDGSFDIVFFSDVLEHVDHPDIFLREAVRVIKPGGTLHFFCPAEGQGIYRLSHLLCGVHIKQITGDHIQQFTRKELKDMVRWNDLDLAHTKYSYHFLGSCMDYWLFTFMLNKRIAKLFYTKNPYYRVKNQKVSFSLLFNAILKLGNFLAFCESSLFGSVAWGACGIHLTAHKSKKSREKKSF